MHLSTCIYILWVPLNIIPSVTYDIKRDIPLYMYMRYKNCTCAYAYFTSRGPAACKWPRILVPAACWSVYEHLLVHTERGSRANQSWMCISEFISVVLCRLPAARGTRHNAIMTLCGKRLPNLWRWAGSGMTLTEVKCRGRYRKWFWISK